VTKYIAKHADTISNCSLGTNGGNTMLKVYDMSSGNIAPTDDNSEYDEEVLYSQWQPIVEDFVALKLQTVEQEQKTKKESDLPEELACIDCDSFINSQD